MPRKMKQQRTIAIRSMRYDDWQPILPKIETILFHERSETFTKKTDSHTGKFGKYFWRELQLIYKRTLPHVF